MTGADDSEELEVLEHHQTKVSIYTVHIYIYTWKLFVLYFGA